MDPKLLRLTKQDDILYKHFRETFPELSVATVTEDQLKSAEAKDFWRSFCEVYNETVEDYNYATLIRLNAAQEYNEANSMIVPRVQFLAIELARNRYKVWHFRCRSNFNFLAYFCLFSLEKDTMTWSDPTLNLKNYKVEHDVWKPQASWVLSRYSHCVFLLGEIKTKFDYYTIFIRFSSCSWKLHATPFLVSTRFCQKATYPC